MELPPEMPQFRENADTSLVCPHRDLSVCAQCASAYEEVVEVYGAHFWVYDPLERIYLMEQLE